MMESWHPLGVVAVISAFNFPVACGRGTSRSPSLRRPGDLEASEKDAAHRARLPALFARAVKRFGAAPRHLLQLVIGGASRVCWVDDPRVAWSAPPAARGGTCGRPAVAGRFGRCCSSSAATTR